MSQLLSSADITNSHNHHHLQTNIQVQPPESGSQFYVGFSEAYKVRLISYFFVLICQNVIFIPPITQVLLNLVCRIF